MTVDMRIGDSWPPRPADAHVRTTIDYAVTHDPDPFGPPAELGALLSDIRRGRCPEHGRDLAACDHPAPPIDV